MVKKFLFSTNPTWATLPLRIAMGLIFMAHGGQKLFGWFGGYGLSATAGFFAQQLGMTPVCCGLFWRGAASFSAGFCSFWDF